MKARLLFIAAITVSLFGCFDGNSKGRNESSKPSPSKKTLTAFDPDGLLEARIRWTEFGIPHIEAENLESLAYGTGYAYALDNFCILSEQMVKIRSERSKYLGPDLVAGSGDSENLISDFGFKALELLDSATQNYFTLSENTRAMLEGYTKGFNYYASEVGLKNLAPECVNAEWIKPITPQELAAYHASLNMMASGTLPIFLKMAFFANPGDGNEFLPIPSSLSNGQGKLKGRSIQIPELSNSDNASPGSNAWSLGSEMTENGMGALLGNPHYPIVGNLRFWQSHLIIPDVLSANGSSIPGYPIIQNGFNKNIAWTHTVSAAENFVLYQLTLNGDRTTYTMDDENLSIESKEFTVDVNMGGGQITSFTKNYYYSHHGLMIESPSNTAPLAWNSNFAFSLRDAATESWDSIDHWLAINLADNLSEFQQAFKDHNGITFVNTLYADKKGNSFYVDNSRVLNLKESALSLMRTDPEITGTHDALKLFILPGDTSTFEPNGVNNYAHAPKLLRKDFVQNSNDSYWATNPAEPLGAYSILYGKDYSPLSLRTRGSLSMLRDSAGNNMKFSSEEIEEALLSNRTYLSELILTDLLSQCSAQGDAPVIINDALNIDISQACTALASWNGLANKSSSAAHVFKEFAFRFDPNSQLDEAFNPADPVNTPNTLTTDGSALVSLAAAVANLNETNIEHFATLGDIQFYEKTLADSTGSGVRYPWAGSSEPEGGFNIFDPWLNADTRMPLHSYSPLKDVVTGKPMRSGLSKEGYQIQYGSSWIFVVAFTNKGPSARGLLTNSQSSNSKSPHFEDQTRYYSENTSLRPIAFTEKEIEKGTQNEISISVRR